MSEIRWCACLAFARWYDDWCRCGHARDEHVDGQRMCVGDVVVYKES